MGHMRILGDSTRSIANSTFLGAVFANAAFEWIMRDQPHDADYPLLVEILRNQRGPVIDVGANYGQSARFFARHLSISHFIAIEPIALKGHRRRRLERRISNLQVVEAMCGMQHLTKESIWIPAIGPFVLDQASSSDLHCLRERMRKFFPFSYWAITYRHHNVPVVSIDDLAEAPMLIKIDVEGSELACLEGAERTLARSRPLLLVEATENRSKIVQFLQGFGYEIFIRKMGRLSEYDPSAYDQAVRNVFAIHPRGVGASGGQR